MMNKHEKTTLEYYDRNAAGYINDTVNADMQSLYDWFTGYLQCGSRIFDLGCGTGRDSKYFMSKGYSVTAVDGSKELCDFASEYIGQDVRCMLFEDLDYVDEFDGIWACASILHVPEAGLADVFARMSRALRKNGCIYVSFKYGVGECERNGRIFTDLTEDSLQKLIEPVGDLVIAETKITGDVREGRDDEKWMNAMLRKECY